MAHAERMLTVPSFIDSGVTGFTAGWVLIYLDKILGKKTSLSNLACTLKQICSRSLHLHEPTRSFYWMNKVSNLHTNSVSNSAQDADWLPNRGQIFSIRMRMGLGQRWQATENPFARTRKWVKGDGEWPSIMIDRPRATTRNPQGVRCGCPRQLARESVLIVKGCFWFLALICEMKIVEAFAGRKPKETNIHPFLVQSSTTAAFSRSCSVSSGLTHKPTRQ